MRACRGKMDVVAAGMYRLAAARGDVGTLQLLSTADHFDVDAPISGFTALMAATIAGKEAAVVWLLQHGASISSVKDDGWKDSVLHYAASRGHLGIAKALLAFGADCKARNFAEKTAAEAAAAAGHAEVAKYLADVAAGRGSVPSKQHYMSSATPIVTIGTGANPSAPSAKATGASATAGGEQQHPPAVTSQERLARQIKEASQRGFDGWGTDGTEPAHANATFRVLAILSQVRGASAWVWLLAAPERSRQLASVAVCWQAAPHAAP